MFESIFVLRILTGSIVEVSSISAGLTLDMGKKKKKIKTSQMSGLFLRSLHWYVMDLESRDGPSYSSSLQVTCTVLIAHLMTVQHDSVAYLVSLLVGVGKHSH